MAKGKKRNVIRGAVCGLVAGAAGSAAMDGYWWAVKNAPGSRPEQKPKAGDKDQKKDEPSTQIVADKASEAITGHEVPKKKKAAAGIGVHYATGSTWGVPFGMIAARLPGWGLLAGLLYGVFIWLTFDEIALRSLDIAPDAKETPTSEHLQALGAHLVYGSTTALFTRLLLKL